MFKPLVSVLIPAYNHELYVQETIRSILAQTYENIELILVDDGSKDATWEKVLTLKEACEARFKRVHFETKENEGTCKTLNRLLSLAQGEYVYLIASDDLAKPQAIAREVAFLANHTDYVLVVGDNELIDGASRRIGWTKGMTACPLERATHQTFGNFLRKMRKDVNFYSDKFGSYETLTLGNYIPNGYLMAVKALKEIGGFRKEAPLEDWYLHLQLSKIGKMKYLDEILFSYRWHDTNTVKRKEYMNKIGMETRQYEENLIENLRDPKWLKLYMDSVIIKKVKFNLLNVLKLYTVKNTHTQYMSKQRILEIFGYKIRLK